MNYTDKPSRQKGVVLFFALIALVVMSLAAVALIRSVDTSTLIAGNLASKQSATTSADAGLETALNWVAANASNAATMNNDSAANGYYATLAKDPSNSSQIAWTSADSLPATSTATGADAIISGKDGSGNITRYVIQRMCDSTGTPSINHCLFGAPPVNNSSQAVRNETEAGGHETQDQSPVYRITARVVGAKNTISYVQAFIY